MGCQESQLNKQVYSRQLTKISAQNKQNISNSKKIKNLANLKLQNQNIQLLQKILKNNFIFYKLSQQKLKILIYQFQYCQYQKQTKIFQKGDQTYYFYIVKKGQLLLTERGKNIQSKILIQNTIFGLEDIKNKSKRTATVICQTNTQMLRINKRIIIKFINQSCKKHQSQTVKLIKNNSIFKHLDKKKRQQLAQYGLQVRYKPNQIIFQKGQPSKCFYYIKSGKVLLNTGDKKPLQIQGKQSFGEGCLVQQQNYRMASAKCVELCQLISFSKFDMMKVFQKKDFEQLQITNRLSWAIKYNKYLKLLPLVAQSLIQLRQISMYLDNQLIVEKGKPINNFIVSLQGQINQFSQLQILNIQYLFGIKYQTQNLFKKRNGKVAFLSIWQLESKFQRNIQNLLQIQYILIKEIETFKAFNNYLTFIQFKDFLINQKQIIRLNQLIYIKSDSNIQFNLSIKHKLNQNVKQISQIQSKLLNAFIIQTYRVYQIKNYYFILRSYIPGQSLYDFIKRQKNISFQIIRHFIACILCQAQYFLSQSIKWKSFKSQDFIINQKGYLILVNLSSLQISNQDYYLSTVNIKKTKQSIKQYSPQINYQSLKQIINNMIFNQNYYIQNQIQVKDLLKSSDFKQKNKQISIPSDLKSLLRYLHFSQQNSKKNETISKIKNSIFFKDFDWFGLHSFKLKNENLFLNINKQQDMKMIKMVQWLQTNDK